MYDPTFAKSMCIRGKKTQIYANILAIVFLSVKYFLLYFLYFKCIYLLLKDIFWRRCAHFSVGYIPKIKIGGV